MAVRCFATVVRVIYENPFVFILFYLQLASEIRFAQYLKLNSIFVNKTKMISRVYAMQCMKRGHCKEI